MNFRLLLKWGFVALALQATPTFAAEEATTSYLVAPEDELGAQYKRDLGSGRVETVVGYIDETTEDLFAVAKKEEVTIEVPSGGLDFNLVWALVASVVLLGLFLKFGSSGNLFSRDHSKKPTPTKPAQGWGLVAEQVPPSTLLGQIRTMENRREALILLLRHSLLSAADATDVRFSRVDTERDALRRLPKKWPHFSELDFILRETEWVHYGGRSIEDDIFTRCLEAGEKILGKGRSA